MHLCRRHFDEKLHRADRRDGLKRGKVLLRLCRRHFDEKLHRADRRDDLVEKVYEESYYERILSGKKEH